MVLLPLTLDDTVGPYFPPAFASNTAFLDLYRPHPGLNVGPRGDPVFVEIRLLDVEGRLAGSSILEFWHPNFIGRLRVPGTDQVLADDPFFEGYGRAYSATGEFVVKTSMPGSLKEGAVKRCPYMTLTIFSDGIARIVTQIFFEGTEDLTGDPVLGGLPDDMAQRLVARLIRESSEGRVYAIDIRMRGENETPFFDDQSAEH